jgi:hypothetical protein
MTESFHAGEHGHMLSHTLAYGWPSQTFEAPLGDATVTVAPTLSTTGPRRRRQLSESLVFALTYAQPKDLWRAQTEEIEALHLLLTVATLHSNSVEEIHALEVVEGQPSSKALWLSHRSPPATDASQTEAVQLYPTRCS